MRQMRDHGFASRVAVPREMSRCNRSIRKLKDNKDQSLNVTVRSPTVAYVPMEANSVY